MMQETQEREEIIKRVAALDIGKAELTCCARVPDQGRPGRCPQATLPGTGALSPGVCRTVDSAELDSGSATEASQGRMICSL